MERGISEESLKMKKLEEIVRQNIQLRKSLEIALKMDEESQRTIREILDKNLKYADLEYDLEGKRLIIP